ncbi:hypothetical protein GCM10029964_085400 [Kibdelosporangium lantanae]
MVVAVGRYPISVPPPGANLSYLTVGIEGDYGNLSIDLNDINVVPGPTATSVNHRRQGFGRATDPEPPGPLS